MISYESDEMHLGWEEEEGRGKGEGGGGGDNGGGDKSTCQGIRAWPTFGWGQRLEIGAAAEEAA